MAKCPYCGRVLNQNEMFCFHCEQDINNPDSYKNKSKKGYIKNIFKKFNDIIGRIGKK